jgi:hypothetical protein
MERTPRREETMQDQHSADAQPNEGRAGTVVYVTRFLPHGQQMSTVAIPRSKNIADGITAFDILDDADTIHAKPSRDC